MSTSSPQAPRESGIVANRVAYRTENSSRKAGECAKKGNIHLAKMEPTLFRMYGMVDWQRHLDAL